MPNWKKVIVSGSDAALSSLNVTGAVTSSAILADGTTDVIRIIGSGSTANTTLFSIDGNNGRLFEVSDDLSDSLFSVNTIAGLPVVEVFSDNRVIMGAFNQNDFVISGSKVGIGTSTPSEKLTIQGNISASGNLYINDSITGSTLQVAGINYPTSDGTSEQVLTTDGSGNLSFADLPSEDVTTTVKNLSGTTLAKGTPIHAVSGSSSGNVTPVIAASASDATTMPATFILGEELADQAEGTGIAVGSITGVDTSTFTVGDVVYVGENGGYTNVKPTSSGNLIQNLGVVTKVHASNGAGFIYGSGRSNDVPNLPTGKIWVGTSNYTVTSSFVHLDESNQRLGIGITSPTQDIDVAGGIKIGAGQMLTSNGTITLDIDNNNNETDRTLRVTQHNGANELFRIQEDGKVGIGTAVPSAELTVQGSIHLSSSLPQLRFSDLQQEDWQISNDNGDFRFTQLDDNITAMYISASGNVGIGTTSPSQKLHVAGNTIITGVTYTDYIQTYSGNSIQLRHQDATPIVHIDTNNSRVGIGNTAPPEALTVEGSISASGDLYTPSGFKLYSKHTSQALATILQYNTNNDLKLDSYNNIILTPGIGEVQIASDLTVTGIVTAQEFHTEFVSASILYSSGSTKFGDDTGDNHNFTGSVIISGSTDLTLVGKTGNATFNVTDAGDLTIDAADDIRLDAGGGDIVLRTGGTEYGRISSFSNALRLRSSVANEDILLMPNGTGKVGIGTSVPSAKLEVSSSGADGIDISVDGNNSLLSGRLFLSNGTSGQSTVLMNNNGDLTFRTQGTPNSTSGNERMRINSSGNVGIGTASPARKLHVSGSGTTVAMKIEAADGNQTSLDIKNSEGEFRLINDGGAFYIYDQTDSADRFRINTSGNVGIGTSSPATELDVSGSIRMSAPGPVLTANSTNQQSGLRLNVTNLTSGADLIRFQNNGTTLLKVKENGNVGIGNNLTATEKLHISGGNVLIETDSGAELNLKNTSSGVQWQVVSGYNGGFEIGDVTNGLTDSSAPFFISSGAQIGIGTTSPSSNLHISASSTSNTPAVLVTNDAGNKIKIGVVRSLAGTAPNTSLIEYDSSLRFVAGVGTTNEVVRFGSNGTVGIGTSAPTQKLEVRDGNLVVSSSNSEVVIGTSSGKPRMQSNGNQDLLFSTANQTNVLYLQDANGRVGIGTTSPTKKLTVAGAISASSGFYGDGSNLTGITTSDGLADILENSNSAGGFSIDMNTNDITNVGEVQATIFNGPSASLSYVTASAGLFIDTPVTLRDGSTSNLALNFSSSANTGFYISQYGAGSGKQVNIRVGGSNIASFNSAGISSNSNVYTGTGGQFRNYAGVWKATTGTAGGDAQFILNGKTIMHLDETDEYVGIGTTAPSAKLHVVGDAIITGKVTAQEFHTEFVSASILYSSGSTKFGDTQDDDHNFTGSLHVSGTVAITNSATVTQAAYVKTGDPGGVTLESFDATTYFGAFLDYVVYDVDKNNMRSGTIQIVFDENGNVQHTDNSTADIGDTTGAYFSTTSSGTSARLWYYADSTEWFVRYHLRYL
jgi:hypothetical protein